MAHVYEATHNEQGTKHAIKLLSVRDPDVRKRLIGEGQMLTLVQHPNLVNVTDVVFHDGRPGLVMELVEGPSLDQWMNEARRSWRERESVFLGLVQGMAHAHSHGIIHRDLQPANILIDRTSGGSVLARVIDFGLAKQGVGNGTTRTGSTLGTPGYMAPEQIRDSKNVDTRADIFALGCLLYVLVCECEPFEGEDNLAIFNATCKGQFRDPESLAPSNIDRAYIRAIRGCLETDPTKRIQDAGALLGVLSGKPIDVPTAGLTSPSNTSEVSKSRSKASLWSISLVVSVVVGLGTWLMLTN